MDDPLAMVPVPRGLLDDHVAQVGYLGRQVARLEVELAEARTVLGESWLCRGETLAEGIRAQTAMLEGLAFVQPERADPNTPTVAVPRDLLDGIVYDLRQGLCLEPETVDVLAGLLPPPSQPDEYSDEQTLEVPSGAHHTADSWNAAYPVGTRVRYWPVWPPMDEYPPVDTVTRSAAYTTGRAVVLVTGIAGGVSIAHVGVIDEEGGAA